jgi:putative flippase GtrA
MAKFAFVGVMNTGVDFAIFAALVYGLRSPTVWAQTVSYLCAFLNSYVWNRSWTFRSSGRIDARELVRFGAVNAMSFLLTTAALLAMQKGWGWNPLAAKAASVAVSLAVNYTGSRLWVFRGETASAQE